MKDVFDIKIEEFQIRLGTVVINLLDSLTRGWFRRWLGLDWESIKRKTDLHTK